MRHAKDFMFLKRLEINGFKSFAQKTALDFGAGIVAVVGPNGSGKSNIIDAFRWLLGEREAKNLRGERVEDLIFAGTPKKARMSQAQVSIVFDNSEGKLPLEYKEVVISRKIARNGSSEYFINDSSVRLKDIVDFFSKIRLGSKGLTIVGQGAADMFIKSSPQERMMMVQEILGLREYELKKNEAERKLKNTRTNLEKVDAVIAEVVPRLRTLKRQTAKWERRFDIEKELTSIDKDFFAYKIKTLNQARLEATTQLPELEQRLSSLERELREAQEGIEKLEAGSLSASAIESLQKEKRELFEHKSELERKLFKLEAQDEQRVSLNTPLSAQKASALLQDIHEKIKKLFNETALDAIKEKLADISRLISREMEPQKGEDQKDFTNDKKDIQLKIKECEQSIASLEKKERELSSGVEGYNKALKEAFVKLESIKEKIKVIEGQKSAITFEEEKIIYRLDDVRHQIVSAGGVVQEYEAHAKDPAFSVSLNEKEMEEAEKKMLRLRGELASIGDIDESLLKEAKEVEAHHDFLKKESGDLSEAIENLGVLIKDLEEKITREFHRSFKRVNDEFNSFFRIMFGGGSAKMKVIKKEIHIQGGGVVTEETQEGNTIEHPVESEAEEALHGIDVEVSIPQKKITSLEMLSGGERTLVSLAVLFSLIAISPPPFLVLDEVDSALDENNSKRFAELVRTYCATTQFVIVTHNRVTMEAADVLYGVTMDETGTSKLLSLKFEDASRHARS